jgi:hypothetical protein
MKISNSEECSTSQLDLFSTPPTQMTVEDGVWDNIPPHNNFNYNTLTFDIPGDNINYIDIARTELWLDLVLQKKSSGEFSNIALDKEVIAPTNNLLHTIFNQVQIFMNNTEVENTNSNYAYRAYLENLLSFGKEEKETLKAMTLFIKDDAEGIASNNVADNLNKGLFKRRDVLKQGVFQLKGRLQYFQCKSISFIKHQCPSSLNKK